VRTRLVTTAEFLDLLGAEPLEPDEPERVEYAPATAADITRAAAEVGWLAPGRYLSPVVPARRGAGQLNRDTASRG
jgi:hypothetical protein